MVNHPKETEHLKHFYEVINKKKLMKDFGYLDQSKYAYI